MYIFVLCILFHLFKRFCVEKNSERSHRESKRERDKCLEAEKMKENENPETLKHIRSLSFFFFFF